MEVNSIIFDNRINAENVLFSLSIGEYIDLVQDILSKNQFQRKRVGTSRTVYSLLRNDLLEGCIIPPIVLALTQEIGRSGNDDLFSNIKSNKESLVVLDGLQRTHTMLDLKKELERAGDDKLKDFLSSEIRVEVYIGLNRLGVLYRMLTLNTGQTPMSLRQQIEMLYLDYAQPNSTGIELVKESDGKTVSNNNQYNFKEIIEGYMSYLERDELPIDKSDILDNIRTLEKLAKEDQKSHHFDEYLKSLHGTITKLIDVCSGVEVSKEYIDQSGTPFGKNAECIFKRAQSFAGFGAAIGKLLDFEAIESIDMVDVIISGLQCEDPDGFIEEINEALRRIKENSKKIGNSQRSFFTFFYRELLNKESDSYLDLSSSVKSGFRKYQSLT